MSNTLLERMSYIQESLFKVGYLLSSSSYAVLLCIADGAKNREQITSHLSFDDLELKNDALDNVIDLLSDIHCIVENDNEFSLMGDE